VCGQDGCAARSEICRQRFTATRIVINDEQSKAT
jgi:hypothetical protein